MSGSSVLMTRRWPPRVDRPEGYVAAALRDPSRQSELGALLAAFAQASAGRSAETAETAETADTHAAGR